MDQMKDYLVCLGAYPEAMEAAMDKAAARGMDLEGLLGLIVDSLAAGDLDCYLEQISPGNSYLAWEEDHAGIGAADALSLEAMEKYREHQELRKAGKKRAMEKPLNECKAIDGKIHGLVDRYQKDMEAHGKQAKTFFQCMKEVNRLDADKTQLLGEGGFTAKASQRVYQLWELKHFDFF